ncbi:MAG: transcription elongation factor GreA [Chloroflexi bacterium]|jgi:transcription elongation factor GreA|nr:transcription elongation factor GreA [Chloroflexota bacterium]
MQQPVFLTAEGIENLRRELEYLVNVRRPELARILRRAIQQGDLSENADYIAAKEEQAFLEGRIQQIEMMLRNAVLIEANGPAGVVDLGSQVTVLEEGRETPEVFRIVGPAEADPLNGKVSHESPLGQALLGRRAGDVVTVDAPAGPITFRVLEVS